jgi:hypothetical protein
MTRVIDRTAGLVALSAGALAALALGLAGSSQAQPQPAPPAAGATAFTTGGCDTPTTAFCDALMPPTPGWKGHVFKLSQTYPASAPPEPQFPWSKFDPTKQPGEYLKAALAYFYEATSAPTSSRASTRR